MQKYGIPKFWSQWHFKILLGEYSINKVSKSEEKMKD